MWSFIFIFLSYFGRNFVKGELLINSRFLLNGTPLCSRMSVVRENYLYQVSDGVEEVRFVYTPAGELMDCSFIVSQTQVKSFMNVCRLELQNQVNKYEDLNIKFSHISEAKSSCLAFQRKLGYSGGLNEVLIQPVKKLNDDREKLGSDEDKLLRRSKRGFTYPGTLWCGAGNIADDYDNLGEFAETDSCCRVHDHCPYVIQAFSSKYGYTNFKWHSISHCDCDNALQACLRRVNDTSSRVMGQAFFNVMEVPCFVFQYEDHCVDRHWYGVCKKYEKLPVAVTRQSTPYDFGGIPVIDIGSEAPPTQTPEQEPTEPTVTGSRTNTTTTEEPSLRNMVTAAEDFIKVIATVSTSHSSTTEATNGETQMSERKKKGGKKNTKKRKQKGKGRKRKLSRYDSGPKAEEPVPVSPSATKADETTDKSNFVDEPVATMTMNDFIDLTGKQEASNDVMKDEPAKDEDVPSTISTSCVKKDKKNPPSTENSERATIASKTIMSAVRPYNTKRKGSKKGRKRQSNTSLTSPQEGGVTGEELSVRVTQAFNSEEPKVLRSNPKKYSRKDPRPVQQKQEKTVTSSGHTPIEATLKGKRHRSKEKEGGNKRRRIASIPPTHQQFAIVTTTATTTTATTTIAQPHGFYSSDIESESSHVTSTTTYATLTDTSTKPASIKPVSRVTTSIFNREQWLKEGRKRKVGPSLQAEAVSLPNTSAVKMFTTDCTSLATVAATTTSKPTWRGGSMGDRNNVEWGHVTATPTVSSGKLGLVEKVRRKKPKSIFNDGITANNDNKTDFRIGAMTEGRTPTESFKVEEIGELGPHPQFSRRNKEIVFVEQSSTPTMSPLSLTVKKVLEQLSRKRRRKSRLSYTQQIHSSYTMATVLTQ